VNSPLSTQTKSSAPSYPLITRERTEKLELLNHLIANLAHAIIICGPNGIGKTLLLKSFQNAAIDSWMFCFLEADNQLSLQKIQELLGETIKQNMPDFKLQALENAFDRMVRREMKIVLVLDDAGLLAPGLIEKIIAYSDGNPVLRIIFALTHSELYLKNATDPAIEDCYQIEIPPLSEKQCGEYLEYLSTLPRPRIQFSAINESMVATLYRETHGIPGNILTQLPKDDSHNKIDYSKPILIYAVIGLIVVALGVQWWSSRPRVVSPPKSAATEKNQNNLIVGQTTGTRSPVAQTPEVSVSQQSEQATETSNTRISGEIRNDVINDSHSQEMIEEGLKRDDTQLQHALVPAQASENLNQSTANKPQVTNQVTVADQVPINTAVPLDEGGHWLMGQPVENTTLQLMALSNEQTITEVMQRHQELGQNLKYLKTKTKKGRDRFILLYGSFTSPEQANVESKNLPKELQKTWPRKISAVQGELNVITQIQTDTSE
jgi:DamX protein